MNMAQKLVGILGVLMLLAVGLYPRWNVEGSVRYDFKQVLEDNGRVFQDVRVMDFYYQERMFLFAARGTPVVPYRPPDERRFKDKEGYSTLTCTGVTPVSYRYWVDLRQFIIEFLSILVPVMLLVFVLKDKKD